jgi:hypothetical protein
LIAWTKKEVDEMLVKEKHWNLLMDSIFQGGEMGKI